LPAPEARICKPQSAIRDSPAAFLDRDGTIIEDVHYLPDPGEIRLLPGAAEGMSLLREAGYRLICVTNQSGVARGILTERKLHEIHATLQRMLAERGVALDDVYYCPHLPEGAVAAYARECDCRKPKPGMLIRAAEEHGIALAGSVLIGDSERDIEAGRAAGCRTVRIVSGDATAGQTSADFVARGLLDAARLFIREARGSRE